MVLVVTLVQEVEASWVRVVVVDLVHETEDSWARVVVALVNDHHRRAQDQLCVSFSGVPCMHGC